MGIMKLIYAVIFLAILIACPPVAIIILLVMLFIRLLGSK